MNKKINSVWIVFNIVDGESVVSSVFSDHKKALTYAKNMEYSSAYDSKVKINNAYVEEYEVY